MNSIDIDSWVNFAASALEIEANAANLACINVSQVCSSGLHFLILRRESLRDSKQKMVVFEQRKSKAILLTEYLNLFLCCLNIFTNCENSSCLTVSSEVKLI